MKYLNFAISIMLYSLMEKGINDVEQGRVQNADDAFARIEQKLGQGKDG